MPVPPQWPNAIPCKIAFVGEAPSDEELREGVPFVGPAGKLYDKILRTAGLDRAEVLTTNVFDVKLPGNDVMNWLDSKEPKLEGDRLPYPRLHKRHLKAEHYHHLDRLAAEIAKAKPNIIIPLGGTALWAFTGGDAIQAVRGAIDTASLTAPGMKILPTLHPAALLRQWQFFHTIVRDVMKGMRESEFPEVRLLDREIWMEPTLRDLEDFRERFLDGAERIAIDIETYPKLRAIRCIGFAADKERALVVPFVDLRRPNRSYWPTAKQEMEAWDFVREICESPAEKILQNGPYDIQWLHELMGISVKNYVHDPRLLHHALFPELPKGLGFLGSCYADVGPWKTMMRHKPEKRDD